MIPNVNNSVKNKIISLLEKKVFEKLNKSRKLFIFGFQPLLYNLNIGYYPIITQICFGL